MIRFTPYELYLALFGYFGWPLTLPLALLLGWAGYRARAAGWKLAFFSAAFIFAYPLAAFWLFGLD